MNIKPHIKIYDQKDKDQLIQILRLNTPANFAEVEELDFLHYLENELEVFLVILCDKKIVGCGGINFVNNGKTARISWDILHPDYQRIGLGKQLLKYRINLITETYSVDEIEVRTSQMAYKFYKQQDFELIKIDRDYWAEGYDLYYMKYNV